MINGQAVTQRIGQLSLRNIGIVVLLLMQSRSNSA
jgi:hypothetical protein